MDTLSFQGDIITEQNIHALDVATWFLNVNPLRAYGTGGRITLPGGAGQECPGYQGDDSSQWTALATICRDHLGFDPTGWERVKVPAGEFDAVKVRRLVYAGNETTVRGEENITEIDWYAPALGGIVRQESVSVYLDKLASCDGKVSDCGWIRNSWNVVELTGHRRGDR